MQYADLEKLRAKVGANLRRSNITPDERDQILKSYMEESIGVSSIGQTAALHP